MSKQETEQKELNQQQKRDQRMEYYWNRVREQGQEVPGFNWPSVELMLNLLYSYDMVVTRMANILGQHSLSLSAFNILMILHRSESKGCSLNQLGELLLVTRSNITGLIDCLEKKGLVDRIFPESDRRVRIAQITEAGEALLASFLPGHYLEIDQMFAGLTDEEKAALSQLLSKLRNNLLSPPS